MSVAHKPPYVNFCDCTLCAKSGGVWGYYEHDEVTIEGVTSSYRRQDMEVAYVEVHFCPKCGTTTHWVTTEKLDSTRTGVNVRLVTPNELAGIEARFPDGRNWTDTTDLTYRRKPGRIGDDVFI